MKPTAHHGYSFGYRPWENKPIYAPFLSILNHFFRRSSELIRSVLLLLHHQNSFAFKCFRAHQAPTVPVWICCVCQCLSGTLACQQSHFSTSVRIHDSRLEVILSVFWHHTKETLIKHHWILILNLTFVSVYLRLSFYSQPVPCRGVYLDKTPFLLYCSLVHSTEWADYHFGRGFLPINEMTRGGSFWGQERRGRGGKTDRGVGETTMKSARERLHESNGDAINEMRPPSASAARLRSNIFYFLMKREEIKRKTHLLKKTQMWWRRTRGRKRWARLSNFYLYFSQLLHIAWKNPPLHTQTKHFQNTSLQSVLSKPF